MEEQLILNVDNELDLLALHMVFLERMKQSLKRFCTAVAHRPLRTEGNKSQMQLWILGQGLNPREELSQEVYFLNVKIKKYIEMQCQFSLIQLYHGKPRLKT
jgi:hypothetical protein